VDLATLSEYLSLEFIVADVSSQNYSLSLLRAEIDESEDVESHEENEKKKTEKFIKACVEK
jgi:hypothetical protein